MDAYAPAHPRQNPNLRQALKDAMQSGPLQGVWTGITDLYCAKIVAEVGFDIVCLDTEHSAYSAPQLLAAIQATNYHSFGKSIPVVRVPRAESELVNYALDAGAGGIIVPHVETKKDAEATVAACLYPPLGHRSAPPLALFHPYHTAVPEGSSSLLEVINSHVAPIVQLESALAIENCEEILAVPGIAGCMIGFGDLRLDMGVGSLVLFGDTLFDDSDKNAKFNAGVKKIVDACHANGVPFICIGVPAEPKAVHAFRPACIWSGVDGYALFHGLAGMLAEAKTKAETFSTQHKSDGPSGSKTKGEKKNGVTASVNGGEQ